MRDLFNPFEVIEAPVDFEAMRLSIASPEKILEWSKGEIKKPETINYRTFKPERDGLFCAKIFGPVKDYECNCGKYKRIKHRGITCDKCGVEVIQSSVRRRRMGHINLAVPVAHIWFLKSTPSRISYMLDLITKEVESVLYCEAYIVTNPGATGLTEKQVLSEEEYQEALQDYGVGAFEADMGAQAIKKLLSQIDLVALSEQLRRELNQSKSKAKKARLAKRLSIVNDFKNSGNRPEWMILDRIPVLPPDLRPLVPLDGGRFATSDLNDLYRRVINRNNRLKKLRELNAPEVIVRNEIRMLQEAVDALFDNGRRGKVVTGPSKRPYKSLSDMLKGKQGRFRQNLLGKRVDYSGRSVIVIGPELKLHQCGMPKKIALELFKPFVLNKLQDRGISKTIKQAKKMVETEHPQVWDILEDVIREHPVLLNRAPTLHRLGIQGFEPKLIEGKAIQLHPLVCVAFNADFDGDQMAVHLPLSIEAQIESRVLMMSTNNILSLANGSPVIMPTQDIVLGVYHLTMVDGLARGAGKRFGSPEEVILAYGTGALDLQAPIQVRMDGQMVETTTGRILLREVIPDAILFGEYNRVINKKALGELIDTCFRRLGGKETVILADRLRTLGYHYATLGGFSICMDDMKVPARKEKILARADERVGEIIAQRRDGVLSEGERYNKVIDVWTSATEEVKDALLKELETEMVRDDDGQLRQVPSTNSIYIMADSGARGSKEQIKQLAGMRGLMAKPSGEIIETPITANFREGLTVLQYFISTHGARKGLADTALKTANSGYLTRKLVDVSQDTVVTMLDCGALDGIEQTMLVEGGEVIQNLGERILGRSALEDILDPLTGAVLVAAGQEIDERLVKQIEEAGLERVPIRSALTCQAERGICAMCYGRDLARGKRVNEGEAVGIIAAQSIGEPGTQLTMRTFHIGGAATGRQEQSQLVFRYSGRVKFINCRTAQKADGSIVVMNRNSEIVNVDESGREKERYRLVYGARLRVSEGTQVDANSTVAEWDPYNIPILTEASGTVKFGDLIDGVSIKEETDQVTFLKRRIVVEAKDQSLRPRISIKDPDKPARTLDTPAGQPARYMLPTGATILVKEGDPIEAGDPIAKMERETTKTKDITGGLPRVSELFEARKPKDQAVITEIDGTVRFGAERKSGQRKVIVEPDAGRSKEYTIGKGKFISVHEGDRVRAGEQLTDGNTNPHDILRVLGEKQLAKYMVDEVQKVYRVQGVRINDKHIEVIVRQMLRKVRIADPGDTELIEGQAVDKLAFRDINDRIAADGGIPAAAEPLLLGITKASLNTESFISAASFQETTKVLTEAAVSGKSDPLRGPKENVIVGRLIPAGTGLAQYSSIRVRVPGTEESAPADGGEEKSLTSGAEGAN